MTRPAVREFGQVFIFSVPARRYRACIGKKLLSYLEAFYLLVKLSSLLNRGGG